MNLEVIGQVILYVFITAAAIQLFFYLFVYGKIITYKPNKEKSKSEPVSIIICAKNEAQNLEKYLPLILEQEYPDFEVIVVNDCSSDNTADVLKLFMAKYKHLRTTYIHQDEKFTHGKKLALTVGIKAAKHEWLLLTDADCFPQSKQWVTQMAQHFTPNTSIVLGYGGYIENKGILNKIIRYDTMFIALQYLTFALFGKPYMGVGRNLAYRSSLFFKNKGFASHARLESGDDDLFVNETANAKNIQIEFQKNAHTLSKPETNFSYWFEQKARHFTTFSKYKTFDATFLGFELLSRTFFYLTLIILLIIQLKWQWVVGIFCARLITQAIIFYYTTKKLNEKNLLLISTLLDIFMPIINLSIYISNAIRPKSPWR